MRLVVVTVVPLQWFDLPDGDAGDGWEILTTDQIVGFRYVRSARGAGVHSMIVVTACVARRSCTHPMLECTRESELFAIQPY